MSRNEARDTGGFGRRRTGRVAAVIGIAVLVASCGGRTEGEEDADPDIHALRALPYLGFSKEAADGESGVVHFDEQRAYPGFNLVSIKQLCRADLLAMNGEPVQRWVDSVPCVNWAHTELLPDGDLLVPEMQAVRSRTVAELERAAHLLRLSWGGEEIFRTRLTAHHDVELTPHGRIATLTVAWRQIPEVSRRVPVRDHGVALLTEDGEVVEELSLYDVLRKRPDLFRFQEVYAASDSFGREDIDLIHANSLAWMDSPELAERDPLYDLGNVLVTTRHQDTVAVIDWAAADLVWAWGQGELSGPHDATVLDSGNFLIFDNGLDRGWSRVIELDPLSKEIVWEYRAPDPEAFFTESRGGAQRLPNGNTLIANSDHGHAFEVTENGEVVWEWYSPYLDERGHRATIVRMKRYEASTVAELMGEGDAATGDR